MAAFGLFVLLLSGLTATPVTPFDAARVAIRAAGVEQGLPNPRVHATFLDHHGRLWVGTQEGAAFLGGAGWTGVPLPPHAPSSYVRAIAETADGAFWFGTDAGGLWRLQRGGWRHWDVGTGLPVSRVNALLADGNALWVATGGGGLLRVEGDNVRPVEGPAERWIWALAAVRDRDGRQRVWAGGESEVWYEHANGWRRLGPADGFWPAGANSIAVRRGPGGRTEVWLSGWKFGVGRWDPDRERFEGPIAGLPSRSPTAVVAVPEPSGVDRIYVGTYDTGLARYQEPGWQVLGPPEGFPSSGVYSLLANPAGRPALWAGTRGAGLVWVDYAGWRVLPALPSLPSTQANCFLETTDTSGNRTLWIGTDRGLVQWSAKGITSHTTAHGLPSDFVTDILSLPGPEGQQVWVATLDGVARLSGSRWETFPGWRELTLARVQSLEADPLPDGGIRVYAGGDGGLAVLERGRWKMVDSTGLPADALFTSLIGVADADGTRSLWAGTRGGGLARLRNGAWQVFGTEHGLANPSIYGMALSRSPDGRRWLWLALVGGGGLARLDVDRPERGFQSWTAGAVLGFDGQGAQRVGVRPDGDIYLTTSHGVVYLDLEGQDWLPARAITYRTGDGLPSAASETGAVYVDHAGRAWVGTARGIAVLDPALETDVAPPGPPVVEAVAVQGRPVDPRELVVMRHQDQRLHVRFGLPGFLRHDAILYRTQLLGLEAAPQDWSPHAEREFTTLPPRDYTLRIWGRDGLGRESAPSDLAIRVVPPWWWSPWLLGTTVPALAVLLLLALRRRQMALVRRAEELERTVAERTQELAVVAAALHEQSLTDPLTGLGNRRSLETQIESLATQATSRRRGASDGTHQNQDLGFLLLDLDHFKSVNDSLGHQAGDRVLQQTADLLREVVREGDLVFRWGGEEFLVVAVNAEAADLPLLAERVRRHFDEHRFSTAGPEPLRRTISLGFAAMPLLRAHPDRFWWEQMVSLADQCLYLAKNSGRNRWVGVLPSASAPGGASPPGPDLHLLVASGWVRQVKGPSR